MRYWHFLNAFNTSPRFVRRVALLVTIGAAVLGGVLIYKAASNEIAGAATYYNGRKSDRGEAVTRESSPAKFRSATNAFWVAGSLCLVASAIGCLFFRKLDDNVADPL